MFVLAPVMSRIPLAALAGVLMVTAWRMNEWEADPLYFGRRFKTAIITFGITMLATITLDLTQAILIGAFLSGGVFLNQIASLNIDIQTVDGTSCASAASKMPGTAGTCGWPISPGRCSSPPPAFSTRPSRT